MSARFVTLRILQEIAEIIDVWPMRIPCDTDKQRKACLNYLKNKATKKIQKKISEMSSFHYDDIINRLRRRQWNHDQLMRIFWLGEQVKTIDKLLKNDQSISVEKLRKIAGVVNVDLSILQQENNLISLTDEQKKMCLEGLRVTATKKIAQKVGEAGFDCVVSCLNRAYKNSNNEKNCALLTRVDTLVKQIKMIDELLENYKLWKVTINKPPDILLKDLLSQEMSELSSQEVNLYMPSHLGI